MFDHVDIYCERLGPGLLAEPVNAITNLAFLVAAAIMWPRVAGMPRGQALCAMLAAIGLASGAFHTVAQGWAGALDSLSIVVFAITYVHFANRDFLGLRPGRAALATLGFFPYSAIAIWLFSHLEWLGGSSVYMPLPVLILFYAWLLRSASPATARGLAIGAAILLASIAFRALDIPTCDEEGAGESGPLGTHFMWHVLNGAMLGWMIEVWRRHMRASSGSGGDGREASNAERA